MVCERVREEQWSVTAAARAAGVSRQTAHKWLRQVVVGLIDVNRCGYRVTKVDTIPGWSEQIASAIFVDKKPAPSMMKPR